MVTFFLYCMLIFSCNGTANENRASLKKGTTKLKKESEKILEAFAPSFSTSQFIEKINGVIIVQEGKQGWNPTEQQVLDFESIIKTHFVRGFSPQLPIKFEDKEFVNFEEFIANYRDQTHARAQRWIRAVKKEEKKYQKISKNWKNYRRQYFGIDQEGNKILVAVFFNFDVDNWKETPIDMDDGGTGFFKVYFSSESNKILKIDINGEA